MADAAGAIRRLQEFLRKNRDAFENDINNRTNVLDLASHYPYSPERWRLFVDGDRVYPEYDAVPQYTHTDDRHELAPAAGETVTFRSAERPRYVVQYELAATFAFALEQELAAGDALRVGVYDGADGWYFEQTGAHDPKEGDFVMERAGTEVYRQADRNLKIPTTEFGRFRLATGWYNITRQEWQRSYPEASTRAKEAGEFIQQNSVVGTGAAPDLKGPRTGNLPVYFEVEASPETTDLVLSAGSAAQVNLGTTTEFRRQKSFTDDAEITATDTWEPIHAFRTDPARDIINTQLSGFRILAYAGDDLDLIVQAHAAEKVLNAGGDPLNGNFVYPVELSDTNNVIQITDDVAQAPDDTGTPVASTADPGGYQIARVAQRVTGQGNTRSTQTTETDSKRQLYGQDVGVLWANGDTTGTVEFEIRTEQDW